MLSWFGSVAKYVATSILEASLDVASMAATSTKVFILEVMGRHAGWIASSGGWLKRVRMILPILFCFRNTIPVDRFTEKVRKTVEKCGFCSIIVSEGVRQENGDFLTNTKSTDAFGHAQLGGVAPMIAELIENKLKLKNHWATADYPKVSPPYLF